MSALVLAWEQPAPPLVLAWEGPFGEPMRVTRRGVPTPKVAAVIGAPGKDGPPGKDGTPGKDGARGQSGIILPGRIATSGRNIVVSKDDGLVLIASPDAVTVTLPADAQDMQQFIIKDALGICAAKPITIESQTGPIDGAASFMLALNYQSLTLAHIAGNWSIL